MDNRERIIDISWYAILKLLVLFFAGYLVYNLYEILVLSLFALIIAVLFEPLIRALEARKVPRILGVVFLYLTSFALFSLLIYLPLASLLQELKNFATYFPYYLDRFSLPLKLVGIYNIQDLNNFISYLESRGQLLSSNVLSAVFSLFGSLSATLFVLTVAIFLSVEGRSLERNLVLLFPKTEEKYILALWRRAERTVALWFLKLLLSSVFVGLLSYISFLLLKIKYPLSLAILGGLFNLIPLIGPTIALLFIFLLGLLDSLGKAFLASLIFILVQQIENNIFTPLITKKLIHVSPTLVLIGLAVGFKLFGLLGGILTIPLIAMVMEFAKGLLERKREKEPLPLE